MLLSQKCAFQSDVCYRTLTYVTPCSKWNPLANCLTKMCHFFKNQASTIAPQLINYKKAVLLQRWPRDAPYMSALKVFRLPDYAYGYFSQIVLMRFCSMDSMNVHRKFEMRSLSRSWDNSNWSFGWGLWTESRGRGGCRGSWMVPFERAIVTTHRPSIVTFPPS